MKREQRLLSQAEAATAAGIDLTVVRLCAESGLIAPAQGYDEADLAELRRVRRLIEDLERRSRTRSCAAYPRALPSTDTRRGRCKIPVCGVKLVKP